jgi:hypothetical protein
MAGDEGLVLRLRVCEDALARLRAVNDPSHGPLIRDIEALTDKLRALLTDSPPSANQSAKPSEE